MGKYILLVVGVSMITAFSAQARLWQLHSGKTLEAELVDVKGVLALLKDEDGKEYRVPVSRLVGKDQTFIDEWKKSKIKQIELKPKSRAATPTRIGGGGEGQAFDSTRKLEIRAAEIINERRAKHGLKPLKFDHEAAMVARMHSQDMVKNGYFSHNSQDGRSPFDRLKKGGVKYRKAGENIAINGSLEGAAEAWMNSPGHRKNILTESYGRTGMGIAKKGGRMWLTQVFMD